MNTTVHHGLPQVLLAQAKKRLFSGLNPEIYKLAYLVYWPLAVTLIGSLRPGKQRQWTQVLVTSLLLTTVYQLDMFLIGTYVMSLVTCVLIRTTKGQLMPWMVAAVTFAHLVLILCTRDRGFLTGDEAMPSTSYYIAGNAMPLLKHYLRRSALAPMSSIAHMWLITKLQSVAWHVYDMRKQSSSEKAKSSPQAISPGFIDILAFSLWCPTLLTPALPYSHYLEWCYEETGKRRNRYAWSKLRKPLLDTGKRILLCLGAFLLLVSLLPDLSYVVDKRGGWLMWFKKSCVLYLFVLAHRFQRYYWWYLWEAGCLYAAVGIDKTQDGELEFAAIRNMDISGFELGFTGRVWRSWNMRMQGWLHSHVFKRLGPNRKSATPYKVLATFALCGVWHGVKPRELAWGITSGVTQLAMRRMETSTNVLITSWGLGRSKYLIYCVEWVLVQGLAILLMAPWASLPDAQYLAVWELYGWIIPGLFSWILALELCRAGQHKLA